MTQSPLAAVKAQYGSKEKLIEKVLGSLEKTEGESKDAFKKRLGKISCRTLLKLAARSDAPKAKAKK